MPASKSFFVNKSNTSEAIKDLWRTPWLLFYNLNLEFNFDLDVCASKENALCEKYFSNAKGWDARYRAWNCNAAFLNPPYSATAEFLEMAAEEAREMGITVVALVNANTDTQWWWDAWDSASEIRLIQGRIAFEREDGEKASGGNSKGQALIIWRGGNTAPCKITMVKREELLKPPVSNDINEED